MATIELRAAQIETYPVPSYWKPQAFVSRAKLPEQFDLVFGNNVRYPVQFAEIAKNPFSARRAVIKRVKEYLAKPADSLLQDPLLEDSSLSRHLQRDLITRVLTGLDPMTPILQNQKFWASKLSPERHEPLDSTNDRDIWSLLLAYNMPLLSKLCLKVHLNGIAALNLTHANSPSYQETAARLKLLSGWQCEPVSKEAEPLQFFTLLSQKRFPVIHQLRPIHALFCGFEPDYWHEAIGHLAILVDREFSEFYQWCGALVVQAKNHPRAYKKLNDLYRIFFLLLEYGLFEKQNGHLKAFGAALTSSFMAMQRFDRGFIASTAFSPKAVLASGLADENPMRQRSKKITLFSIDSLQETRGMIRGWLGL